MRAAWLLLAFVVACKPADTSSVDDTDGDGDPDTDPDSDTDPDTDTDTSGADVVEAGDLASGAPATTLSWAHGGDNDPCFPQTEDPNFNGNFVYFEFDKQGNDLITFEVDPESGVDVSLVVMEFASASEREPESASNIARCEAKYDSGNDSNPGEPEIIDPLYGFPERPVLIGVAGANHSDSGGFTLRVWRASSG